VCTGQQLGCEALSWGTPAPALNHPLPFGKVWRLSLTTYRACRSVVSHSRVVDAARNPDVDDLAAGMRTVGTLLCVRSGGSTHMNQLGPDIEWEGWVGTQDDGGSQGLWIAEEAAERRPPSRVRSNHHTRGLTRGVSPPTAKREGASEGGELGTAVPEHS
jgi:hypothetical protein